MFDALETLQVYSNTLDIDVQLSNVCIVGKSGDRCTLFVEIDNVRYALCTLEVGKVDNYTLSVALPEGEVVSFTAVGKGVFHVTGMLIQLQKGLRSCCSCLAA
jgi:hypothetical protein